MPSNERRLVYVTTAGCSVCREKEPVAEEIAAELNIPLDKVDSDTEEGAARAKELRVRGVPTLALILGERTPFRLVGRMITRETVEHLMARL